MTDELKPCPICGGVACLEEEDDFEGDIWYVWCKNCLFSRHGVHKAGAVEAWNTYCESKGPTYIDELIALHDELENTKPTRNVVNDTIRKFENIINGSYVFRVMPVTSPLEDLSRMSTKDLWNEFLGDMYYYSDRMNLTRLTRLTAYLAELDRRLNMRD